MVVAVFNLKQHFTCTKVDVGNGLEQKAAKGVGAKEDQLQNTEDRSGQECPAEGSDDAALDALLGTSESVPALSRPDLQIDEISADNDALLDQLLGVSSANNSTIVDQVSTSKPESDAKETARGVATFEQTQSETSSRGFNANNDEADLDALLAGPSATQQQPQEKLPFSPIADTSSGKLAQPKPSQAETSSILDAAHDMAADEQELDALLGL